MAAAVWEFHPLGDLLVGTMHWASHLRDRWVPDLHLMPNLWGRAAWAGWSVRPTPFFCTRWKFGAWRDLSLSLVSPWRLVNVVSLCSVSHSVKEVKEREGESSCDLLRPYEVIQ